jgi:hypothetical protein
MKPTTFAAALVTCVTLIAPVSAWASPLQVFDLENVTVSGGGTLGGSFNYNAGVYSSIDITGGGSLSGDVFTTLDASKSSPTKLTVDTAGGASLTLYFASSLPTNTALDPITFGLLVADYQYSFVTGGSVQDPVSTPLPATLPLFATGLGALGLFGWRRKRKNAAGLAAA